MGIAASVALIAIGAVLAFAPDYEIAGIDLEGVGIILMLVGCLLLAVTVVIWTPSRRAHTADYASEYDRQHDTNQPNRDGSVSQTNESRANESRTDESRTNQAEANSSQAHKSAS